MKKYLFIINILLAIVPIQSALAALLIPLDVNDLYIYNKHDSASPPNEWTVLIQGLEYVDVGGQQYVKAGTWNENGYDDYNELLIRSTENAVYTDDGSVMYQMAPVGTTWSFPSSRGSEGTGMDVNEIIAIESVTIPYGTFNNAYVHRVYFDPDDPLLPNTAYWYDYIVPGVGFVKQIDYSAYSNSPKVMELVQITSVPIPAAVWLFGSGLIGLIGVARRKKA
jgi:hypothetical protein